MSYFVLIVFSSFKGKRMGISSLLSTVGEMSLAWTPLLMSRYVSKLLKIRSWKLTIVYRECPKSSWRCRGVRRDEPLRPPSAEMQLKWNSLVIWLILLMVFPCLRKSPKEWRFPEANDREIIAFVHWIRQLLQRPHCEDLDDVETIVFSSPRDNETWAGGLDWCGRGV